MSASEDAMWRIALRNAAPSVGNLLKQYAEAWGEMYFNIYIAFSYQPGKDVYNPENTLMIMQSILSGKAEQIPYDKIQEEGGSELQLILDMFPQFFDRVEQVAKEWDVSVYDVFLMCRYKPGIKNDHASKTEDSLQLQFRTKKSSGKDLQKIIE